MIIGILALQGGYAAHERAVSQLGVAARLVRKPEDLRGINGLIIPGGESSTLLKFLAEHDFFAKLQAFGQTQPVFGTCAGAILLANEVRHPTQASLSLLDIAVERNGYGRQIQSHIVQGDYLPTQQRMEMVFIRAPRIVRVGAATTVLAQYQHEPVAVQQGRILAATFHPELSNDLTLHRHFCQQF